jgi:hypothetical protein
VPDIAWFVQNARLISESWSLGCTEKDSKSVRFKVAVAVNTARDFGRNEHFHLDCNLPLPAAIQMTSFDGGFRGCDDRTPDISKWPVRAVRR